MAILTSGKRGLRWPNGSIARQKDLVLAEEPFGVIFGYLEVAGPIYHLNPIGLKTKCDLNSNSSEIHILSLKTPSPAILTSGNPD